MKNNKVYSFFRWSYVFLSWWILVIPYVIFLLFPFRIFHPVANFMEKRLWAASFVWIAGIHLNTKGIDKVDWSRSYIIMSNHESLIDIFVYMAKLPMWFRWVAKKILFEVPVLGWSMYMRKDISIDRRNRETSIASYNKAAKSLQDGGRSIMIFPKGTRGETEEIGPFKKGPFMLAIQSQCPILPIVIHGTGQVLKRGSLIVNPCNVEMRVGQPIETKGLTEKGRDELMRRVHGKMSAMHKAMGGVGGDPNNVIAESGFKGKKKSSKLLIPLLRIANVTTIGLTLLGIYLLLKAAVGV